MLQEKYVLELKEINKSFDKVNVLNGIDFSLKEGEVKGLVGKNGAGKSTLLKIIQGIYIPDSGSIKVFDQEITSTNLQHLHKSIGMVYQDFSLIPDMTVLDNLFLNEEIYKGLTIDRRTERKKALDITNEYGIKINLDVKVNTLNTSDMQMVEICKQLVRDKKILLLDEPTAALEDEQSQKLYRIIQQLKKKGISIVFITHHLKEILDVCDSVDVLRDGYRTMSQDIKEITLDHMISAMIGESNEKSKENKKIKFLGKDFYRTDQVPALELREVYTKNTKKPVSFKLFQKEILGIAGLKGSGRTEIFNLLFGIDKIEGGKIYINGVETPIKNTKDAMRKGIFLIPENRQTQGLCLTHDIYHNMTIPWVQKLYKNKIFVNDSQGIEIVNDFINSLHLKCNNYKDIVSNLSGGNQQKVVIGKAFGATPNILLMDDPTYGVDVHATSQIMEIVNEYREAGGSVILVSSELEELADNCDRVVVLFDHEIREEFINDTRFKITEQVLTEAVQ